MAEQNTYSVNFLEKCIVLLHNMYILVFKLYQLIRDLAMTPL